MYTIIDIIRDEIENKQEWVKLISNELLTRATLKVRKPHKQKYYYLHYRENGKTVDKYLGKLTKEDVNEWKHKLIIRKHQKKKIPKIKKEIKFLQKLLDYAGTLAAKEKKRNK